MRHFRDLALEAPRARAYDLSVRFERTIVDAQPFGDTGTAGATVGRLLVGESLARLVEGDTANSFRRRVSLSALPITVVAASP